MDKQLFSRKFFIYFAVTMIQQIHFFTQNSPYYLQALALRHRLLRKPLNIDFTAQELANDIPDIHIGLFDNEEIKASVILSIVNTNQIKMRQMVVDDSVQKTGYGKKLMLAAEAYAKKNKYSLLIGNARKTAVPFYLKLGFSILGEEFVEVGIPHYKMQKHI